MKLKEVLAIESEVIAGLRVRAEKGDNDAAAVLLAHLRQISRDIAEWQKSQEPREQD